MRKWLVRALVFLALALGVAIGAAGAAGAISFPGATSAATDGMTWGWGGAAATAELARA